MTDLEKQINLNLKIRMQSLYKLFLLLCLLLASSLAIAETELPIKQLLQSAPPATLAQRIDYFSTALLNRPYLIEPLGEGEVGKFNQEPLYRLDGFDCQTFVETVIALSLAHNFAEFKAFIIKIRYANGEIAFTKRNHFPSADWLPNNAKNGFIEDMTQQVAGNHNFSVARAYINRQQWYQQLTPERIKIPNLTDEQLSLKLSQLRALGKTAVNTWASVDFIPRQQLMLKGKLNKALCARISNGAIILIVNRPPAAKLIGTDMNITHMGFAIWRSNQLYFRAASTLKQVTTDVLFSTYLRSNPGLRGISIWRVIPINFNSRSF